MLAPYVTAVLLAILLTSPGLSAQTEPRFDGSWTRISASNGNGGLGEHLLISQGPKTLTIEHGTGSQSAAARLVFNLDGSESRNVIIRRSGRVEEVSRATWHGQVLLIVTQKPNGEQERRLALDGGNLIIETSISGFGPAPTKVTYEKTQ